MRWTRIYVRNRFDAKHIDARLQTGVNAGTVPLLDRVRAHIGRVPARVLRPIVQVRPVRADRSHQQRDGALLVGGSLREKVIPCHLCHPDGRFDQVQAGVFGQMQMLHVPLDACLVGVGHDRLRACLQKVQMRPKHRIRIGRIEPGTPQRITVDAFADVHGELGREATVQHGYLCSAYQLGVLKRTETVSVPITR
uniref:Uncharacterized protein n=1 Tax=Anopheles merus TaxID=30066 RepID=A0A182UYU5_ANOME